MMALGEKLKQARLELGLSQRQLCGDRLTRNMLSQIENGSARPSMDTLRYLAARLEKPVSYFLDEDALTSPNQQIMASARDAYAGGLYSAGLDILADYRGPDAVFDPECALLRCLCLMGLAEAAIADARLPYARELLAQAETAADQTVYRSPALTRQRLLLQAQADPERAREIAAALPSDDRELLLRARVAMDAGQQEQAAAYLNAAQDRDAPQWHLLRGSAYFSAGDFVRAAKHLLRAEADFPRQTLPRLETCFREMGDFKRAYEYACKQR